MDKEKAIQYLLRFGYLNEQSASIKATLLEDTKKPSSTPFSNELSLRLALMDFQRVAMVPVTGEFDEATLRAMERPRCGVPDRPSSISILFVPFRTVWDHSIITFRFTNRSPDLPEDRQRAIIKTAFDRWEAVVPLTFREAGENADINIAFAHGDHGDRNPFDDAGTASGNILAHAFYPPPNGGDIAGDMHFDEFERWQEGFVVGGFDLLTVAVHELGHSLGLKHTTRAELNDECLLSYSNNAGRGRSGRYETRIQGAYLGCISIP